MSVHAQLIILCEYYTLWPVMHSKMATGPWSSQPINLSMSERMQIKSGEMYERILNHVMMTSKGSRSLSKVLDESIVFVLSCTVICMKIGNFLTATMSFLVVMYKSYDTISTFLWIVSLINEVSTRFFSPVNVQRQVLCSGRVRFGGR